MAAWLIAAILTAVALEHRYLKIVSGEWRGPIASLTRSALRIAEVPYRAAMQLRNSAYDRGSKRTHDLGRPTISVGNITAGGTGKTPVVAWLAGALQSKGSRPAILMRGYRKAGSQFSDEQSLLQSELPDLTIEADPDRVAAAARVIAREPQTACFILDDAFQHRRARRDFDLVLVNATAPFGFGHVHPRGLLREPLRGLSRASAVLVTHASEIAPEKLLGVQETIRSFTNAPIFHCDHVNTEIASEEGPLRELSDLSLIPFILVTGIGQPQSLASSLRRFANAYVGERFYDDHHHYSPADVESLAVLARQRGAKALVTTEKDYAKLKPLWRSASELPTLYRLQLKIRFWENEEPPLLGMIQSAITPR